MSHNILGASYHGWLNNRPALIVLVFSVFALIMIQTALLSRQQTLDELERKTEADLNRYILSVEQKLDRFKDLPKLLSTHSELYAVLPVPENETETLRVNRYLEQVNETIGASDTYLMNAEGLTVAASNWASERPFVGGNFRFRPYFQDAIRGQAGRYFALGTTSLQRGYFFSYPVFDKQQVVGVVVVKIDLNDVEEHWADPLLDILVTDADDVIFISTRPEWMFRTLRPLPPEDQQRVVQSLRYGDSALIPLDIINREPLSSGSQVITLLDQERKHGGEVAEQVRSKQYLLLSKAIPDTGLHASVLASLKPVEQRMITALMLVAFIYVALVLLILVLVARHRIKRERTEFQTREHSALEESEARVRAIIDNTHAGLITLDTKGCIASLNPTAEKLFGFNAQEICGQYFSQLLAEEDRAVCWHHIMAPEERESELMVEASGRRKDHSVFPIELTIGTMNVDSQQQFLVTIHDITERKEYEQQLKNAREDLEFRVQERTADLSRANSKLLEEMALHSRTQNELIQTAKLAVLGQLSAGINHELNQPLTAIRNYADNASAFLQRSKYDVVASNLHEISGLTERMAKIIHPLKEFARKSSGQIEIVSIRAVRDGAMSVMYGRLDKEEVTVVWPQNLDELYVRGDTLRLEQVFVNLLSNALQAMTGQAEKRIEIDASLTQDRVTLTLRDLGPGLEEPGKVFEPFYTTKKAGQGLGLGLSISHRIIESLQGRLSAGNHPDGGAVFTLELPRAQVHAADEALDKTGS
ncbi:PAS domain S-box protein [Nitrincola alkalilacustris]|uniref:PAS domain S-box protein n=1 Tax=Nitrincola alkalilacustris TaxID=1571224 RepID=UPI00124D9BEE|nr:PAS domain S-box protein [Nitrincola alkalilacustris]